MKLNGQFRGAGGLAFPSAFRIDAAGSVTFQAADTGPKRLRRVTIEAYDGGKLNLPNVPHPVVVDLQGLRVPSSAPLLRDHDIGRVVGHSEAIEVTASAILVNGVISGTGDAAREVLDTHDNGFGWQASIGGDAFEMELFGPGERVQVNGQWFSGPVLVARAADLKEISFVSLGAAKKTSARIAASAAKGAVMTFEEYCASLGIDPATLSEAGKAALMPGYEASKTPVTADGGAPAGAVPAGAAPAAVATPVAAAADPVAAMRAAAAAEAKRIADVTMAAGDCVEIRAKAISEGWSVLQTENAVLRAGRASTNGPHFAMGSTGRDVDNDVAKAALCLSGKLQKPEQHFEPKTLEIAAKHCKGWGLQRVIVYHAQRNGWRGDAFSAFHQGNVGTMLRAAFSTLDLSTTLGDAAAHFARQGIRADISTVWRTFSSRVTVNDFRPTAGRSLIESNTYLEVGKGGEIPHGTLSESTWTNRAKSFARMLAITFQDQRNDDLGFLSSAEKLLGRGASRAILTAWFTEFMDNSTFFTSGRGNYASGVGTVLSSTSLGTANAMFQAQTTEEGDTVNFIPKFLFVPLALEVTAKELWQSTNINTGGASTSDKVPNANIWGNSFMPVTAAQLSNSAFTGNSTTAWYLLADPSDAAAMEVCFLDGKEDPTIETADADFNTLGIQMRGHIHFGVKRSEYRAGVKMAGA